MPAKPSREVSKLIQAAMKVLPKNQHRTAGKWGGQLFSSAAADDLSSLPPSVPADMMRVAQKIGGKRNVLQVDALPEHTLVSIVMPNRPFIVDSVLADVVFRGHAVRLVVHPLIDDGKHGLKSLVMVVLDEMDADKRNSLKTSLKEVLSQVKQVTGDWQKMLSRVGETIAQFRVNPPPVPAEEIAETVQFLEWLSANNFTLLGLREYAYEGSRKSGELKALSGSALGILRDPNLTIMTRGGKPVVMTPQIRDFLFSAAPLIITKANVRSRVHRRTHLDYIGIKRYNPDGSLAGELRVVGLFTSTAYTKSVMTIPVLRHKAHAIMQKIHADPAGHSGKALSNILETWPRDEMFQADADTLSEFTTIAMQLEERPRVRVLPRADEFDRFVSVLVYVPRDRYDSEVRQKVGAYLAGIYDGYLSAFYPVFLENGLTRVQFVLGRKGGKTPVVPRKELEHAVTEISRTWADRFNELAEDQAGHTFSASYQNHATPEEAKADAELFAALPDDTEIALDFHDCLGKEPGHIGLKLFHLNSSVPLSRRVPLLENLGFRVIEESTFDIVRADGSPVFLHDMVLRPASGDVSLEKIDHGKLIDCLHAVWRDQTDNDSFNGLVLAADLDWRQCAVFRAYARYLRQIRSRFTAGSMARTLAHQAAVTRNLARLFDLRFGPSIKNRGSKTARKVADLNNNLEAITSSDDDRIIRNFINLMEATLRTNFYQDVLWQRRQGDSAAAEPPVPVLALKIDPSLVNIMPQPVPYREIFVSSPRVEGLHLRFGPVARGGLRWSDRAQDYRTEVLGLVKAQQVKNAVIVPVGSKGGFLPKRLPEGGDRNAVFEEGRSAYKIFISSMLSLTDNLEDGKVVPPQDTVRHDGDDPYFVVAADKGTATFSDTANAISQQYDFWLDDAFASGGSAGYDHKKMGITARGAWEAVKRHFREMNRDIQTQPFTAAGVGDMSGDVFGNGMLLSEQTRLIAAFDHRDIFIDPDPDIEKSFKERQRLFDVGRSSWQDYKTELISKGGGVFSRAAKSITLSRQAAEAIGCDAGSYTPQEVMNFILKAPIDLMWFGGIGTYIRASHESDADAGDRGNDAIRVTSKELRCKVIGEGANLGVTHPGRIEFSKLGGRCNSDAIDNSAGVNSSDVEVNIKIALAAAMKSGKLTRKRRDTLLESMTETVAELVLRNNYLQTLSISLAERQEMEDFAYQQRLMHNLEARDKLDRVVEDLPDDVEIMERMSTNECLTRPEIGVLFAYAKIVALDDLVATDVPDDPYLGDMLTDYFPPKMQKAYSNEIEGHRLKREIIGTVLANSMVNRGGTTFITRVADRTGASIDAIARSYATVRDSYSLPQTNAEIDALDARIDGDLQLELYAIAQERVVTQTIWFVRYGDYSKGIGSVVSDYREAIEQLMPRLEEFAPQFLVNQMDEHFTRYVSGGVPEGAARTLARLPIAGLIPDILYAAKRTGSALDSAARVFFDITEAFKIGRLIQAAQAISADDYYDSLALDRAMQGLQKARRDIVIDVLNGKGDASSWLQKNSVAVVRTNNQMAGIVDHDNVTVSRLTVAANVLGDLARG